MQRDRLEDTKTEKKEGWEKSARGEKQSKYPEEKSQESENRQQENCQRFIWTKKKEKKWFRQQKSCEKSKIMNCTWDGEKTVCVCVVLESWCKVNEMLCLIGDQPKLTAIF